MPIIVVESKIGSTMFVRIGLSITLWLKKRLVKVARIISKFMWSFPRLCVSLLLRSFFMVLLKLIGRNARELLLRLVTTA